MVVVVVVCVYAYVCGARGRRGCKKGAERKEKREMREVTGSGIGEEGVGRGTKPKGWAPLAHQIRPKSNHDKISPNQIEITKLPSTFRKKIHDGSLHKDMWKICSIRRFYF